tara:strand:- start:906 stop:1790 length:885 start_codon:yes stop_codon:yes gene_type:complete
MPRGRPKGSKNKSTIEAESEMDGKQERQESSDLEALSIGVGKRSLKSNETGPAKFKRDEYGLLQNVQYIFNEDGSVDWRAMIKDEHLFPNKGWFESRKRDVPKTIDGLGDHQLLIKLSGIKELARLRGFSTVSYYTEKCELNHVAVNCTMSFIGNYETEGEMVTFQDMANATLDNTSSFATKFLETIACNRAFVRCVRNFLNVHIVGDDEIDKSNKSNSSSTNSSALTPHGILESHAESLGCSTFEDFKDKLREWYKQGLYDHNDSSSSPAEWSCYKDIPPKDARIFIKLIKSL